MYALFAWLCVSLSTFSSPFENLSTWKITSRDLTFSFLVLFQMQSGANDNINSSAVSKITVKRPLHLSIVFYKWENWEANIFKGWQMLHTYYKWLRRKLCLVTSHHVSCSASWGLSFNHCILHLVSFDRDFQNRSQSAGDSTYFIWKIFTHKTQNKDQNYWAGQLQRRD